MNILKIFIKIIQNRIDTKKVMNRVGVVTGLLVQLLALTTGSIASAFAGLSIVLLHGIQLYNNLSDEERLIMSPLYKEYKASLPESTGLLKKAAKLLRK